MVQRTARIGFAWLFLSAAGVHGGTTDDSLSPELMLFEEIPTVITATRTAQSLRDVPGAVHVITAEDIRVSGATSLQQLLASVPGLDVVRISRGDVNITSRGLVAPSSSSLLVMIDGRSVYLDFFGVTLWEQLNVTLFDIARIEVVHGPGSALYGANAFAGTINIVTKDPRDLPRLRVQGGIGPETGLVTATGAAHANRLAVKGSVQYDSRDHFRNDTNAAPNALHDRHDTGPRSKLLNATVEYTTHHGTELLFSGGVTRGQGEILTGAGTFEYEGPTHYAQVRLDHGSWTAKTFYSRNESDLDTVLMVGFPLPNSSDLTTSVFDFDVQRTVQWSGHQALAGLNMRRLVTDSEVILGSREEETLYSGFLQDVFHIRDDLTGVVSVRLDEHPKAGFQISPRAALVYKIGETGRLRASFARSFQNPTQIENYTSFAPVGFFSVVGNEDLDPTWMTAYEFGGEVEPLEGLRLSGDFFLNTIRDFKSFVALTGGLPIRLGFVNDEGRSKVWGSELVAEWSWRSWLRGFGNYSFQSAHGPLEQYTPRHKASLGLRGELPVPVRYALTANFTSHTELDVGAFAESRLPGTGVRSRFTVDGFLAWQPRDGVELGLHATNLFHQVRQHYPGGGEIGSELMATLTVEF